MKHFCLDLGIGRAKRASGMVGGEGWKENCSQNNQYKVLKGHAWLRSGKLRYFRSGGNTSEGGGWKGSFTDKTSGASSSVRVSRTAMWLHILTQGCRLANMWQRGYFQGHPIQRWGGWGGWRKGYSCSHPGGGKRDDSNKNMQKKTKKKKKKKKKKKNKKPKQKQTPKNKKND